MTTYTLKYIIDPIISLITLSAMVLYCPTCGALAAYSDSSRSEILCKDHMKAGMKLVRNLRYPCDIPNCPLGASFGLDGKKTRCSNHKEQNMTRPRVKSSTVCTATGCRKVAELGYEAEGKRLRCLDHPLTNMINLDKTPESCNALLCAKVATHGYKSDRVLLRCNKHKLSGMTKLPRYRICIVCGKAATYGLIGQNPEYCKQHAITGTVDVIHKQCAESGCTKRPWANDSGTVYCSKHCIDGNVVVAVNDMISSIESYFDPTIFRSCRSLEHDIINPVRAIYGMEKTKPLYCGTHKSDNHWDVVHPLCITEYCTIRAQCGDMDDNGNQVLLYCARHNQNHQNLAKKKCDIDGCETCVCYGVPDETPSRCATHADKTTMKPTWKTCLTDGCDSQPTYGFATELKKHYCAKHADKKVMVAIGRSKCANCDTQPTYRLVGTTKATHCAKHRDPLSMESTQVRCIECGTQPTFGLIGTKTPTHCREHYDPAIMVDVRHDTCEVEGCGTRPSYGYASGKAICCKDHGLSRNMQNVISPICPNCKILSTNPNYKPYCAQCFYELNPEAERVINFKTKELAFTNAVKERYPMLIQDRVIDGGTSRCRPDALIDAGTHCIIIEIDERQHSLYEDEEGRLERIHADLKFRPLTVIRLNPDGYQENAKQIRGCWVKKAFGKLEVKPRLFKRRVDKLLEVVDHAIANPVSGINIVKLFFTTKTSMDDLEKATSGMEIA